MKKLSVALVGCGIGRSHIEEGYIPNADLFDLKVVCDLDAEKSRKIAGEFGIKTTVQSFDALLDMPDIDVIDICTPPQLHLPMIIKALKAGKHVICEKPLVGSLAQMDMVIEQEKASVGRLMPIFQYRFGDGVQQAKAIIDAGIAGRPYVGSVETFWRRDADYYSVPWRGRWATELGGVLMTHAIHQHDIFTHLMGDITRVFGRVATRVNDIEVEDCVSASVELSSGALGSFTATLGSADEISRIRLAFENVTFESDLAPYNPGDRPWKILPRNERARASIEAVLANWVHIPSRFQTQLLRFYHSVASQGPLPVSTTDARRALELVTAFYQSAWNGNDVTLPISSEHETYHNWVPAHARTPMEVQNVSHG
jgi:predicted dehydrogenase